MQQTNNGPTMQTFPAQNLRSAEDRSPLNWKTLTSSAVDEAMFHWRYLSDRVANQSIATHPDWVESWIRYYGDQVPFRFLIAEADGLVRGIALLTEGVNKKNGPLPVRSVHLGTAGEPQLGSVCVEYNRLLAEEGYADAFLSGVADTIENDMSWETLCLDGFWEADLGHWQNRYPQAEIRYRDSCYFDFETARESGGDLLSHLGKSTRSNIRRRLKKYGDLQTEWATSLAQAEDIFAELVMLHQARWNDVGEPGAFASDRFLSFQQQLISRLFGEQRVVLFRVRHEAETVGCLLLLVDQNRMLDYLSGFAAFDAKPSIGLISHYLCMEQGLLRGFSAYDFLVGDKQHKQNLSTHRHQLCWFAFHRPTLKNRTVEALRQMKRLMQGKRSSVR